MIKRSTKLRWRISRIRGNRAEQIGVVEASSPEAAIKIAFKEYEITDRHEQSRIAAMPEG